MSERAAFLQSVDAFNEKFNSVEFGGQVEPLVHSFWTADEIRSATESLRADWELPLQFIPFYGDWHTLFCLDQSTGAVVYHDDARAELFRWPSYQEFVAALRYREDEPDSLPESDVVHVILDPALLKS